ncbi:tripeptidyl-peptidase-like protein [Lindgomyces ingoldianus]|uniref:Tripeptidyl-peptidase-like protein n=1 Tax=Lindgomyces ingoldianus TaxID=673940 RepID=A0ACB6RCH8_9PLEO|nr:tripeptidyl-peptidase-like protein [Lindgomyces ingoldianus]KAF2477048.1 tripeptidyl-peptidase-like protein [Lindgomyces ingoldianus]
MRYSTLVAGVLSLAGVATCATTSHVETLEPMENLQHVPQGWKEVGAPAQTRRLHFRIAVTQPNHDLFEQTLMEISTPHHQRYGQHLKRDELKALIKPRAESTDSVLKWLKDSGISSDDIVDDGEWVNFVAPVSTAEKMMDTTFKTYQSLVRKEVKKIRALKYSVPKDIHDHIDMIQPTTRFGQIRPQMSQIIDKQVVGVEKAVNASCNNYITPQCLKELYNFADFKADPKVPTLIGVNGFLEEYARFKDFADFAKAFAPWAVGSNFTWTSVNGGILDQRATNDSVEANLDVQYTAGLVAPAIKTNYYSTPGRGMLVPDLDQPSEADNQNEPYLDLFTYLVGLPDGQLPQVLTTSYGEDEQSVPEEYSKKVCDMIGQLGTRGVSVLFSSGDTGVGSACQSNDGKNTTRFLPIFPASCPYVTSVGGTTNVSPEQAVSFSSGGFSDRWPRPSYQDAAVTDYLKKLGSRWEGLYNPNGRGFPDVAAQGTRYRVIDKGTQISVGGTSASAPTFASIVGLLNNARISAGKPALGFLNPWIYSQGYKGLNDITKGGSTGCVGRSIYSGLAAPYVPYASWNATEGWDPVTGYGTPDFGKLLKISESGTYSGRRGLHGRF